MARTYSDNLQDYKFNQAYTNPVQDGTWPHGLICTIVDTKGNTINVRNEKQFLPTLKRKHLDETNIGTITVYNVTQQDIFEGSQVSLAISSYIVKLLQSGVIDQDDLVFYDGGVIVTVNKDPQPQIDEPQVIAYFKLNWDPEGSPIDLVTSYYEGDSIAAIEVNGERLPKGQTTYQMEENVEYRVNYILKEGVTTIESNLFSSIQFYKVILPNTIRKIESYAFTGSNLTEIQMQEGIEEIEIGAFECELKDVTFPSTLTSIDNPFMESSPNNLTFLSTTPPSLYDGLSYPTNIYIPAEAAFAYMNDSDWAEYAESFELYDIKEDGVVYALFNVSTTGNVKVLYNGGGGPPAPSAGSIIKIEVDGTPITFASTVYMEEGTHLVKYYLGDHTAIAMCQFYSCDITKMWMSNSITTLGDGFIESSTKLEKVTLSNNIQTIPSRAFYNDTNLQDVVFPESVTDIRGDAFSSCDKLKYITLPGVISIQQRAFIASEPKEKVVLGDSVTSIGDSAFNTIFILEIHTVTPPNIRNSFVMNGSTREIYVPAESVDTYKAASGWSDFASYIQAIPEQ